MKLSPFLSQIALPFPPKNSTLGSHKDNFNSRGGCSSAGRAPDCGSGGRGFDPHHSPQNFYQRESLN